MERLNVAHTLKMPFTGTACWEDVKIGLEASPRAEALMIFVEDGDANRLMIMGGFSEEDQDSKHGFEDKLLVLPMDTEAENFINKPKTGLGEKKTFIGYQTGKMTTVDGK